MALPPEREVPLLGHQSEEQDPPLQSRYQSRGHTVHNHYLQNNVYYHEEFSRLRLKRDDTRAETRFRLLAQ